MGWGLLEQQTNGQQMLGLMASSRPFKDCLSSQVLHAFLMTLDDDSGLVRIRDHEFGIRLVGAASACCVDGFVQYCMQTAFIERLQGDYSILSFK